MCFSATASFSIAAVTTVIGVAAIRQVRHPSQILLAIVPLLFAAQQMVEGVLWLLLTGESNVGMVSALSFVYLVFANVLWPVYVPLTVLMIEPDQLRRRVFLIITFFGLVLSTYLLAQLLSDPAATVIRNHSIDYGYNSNPLSWRQLPYLVCTCVPLILTSHRIIQVFGVVALIGFVVSAYAYFATFTSVWCFFAAADSTILYIYFRRQATSAGLLKP